MPCIRLVSFFTKNFGLLYSQYLLHQWWRLQIDMVAMLALCKLWSTCCDKCEIARGELACIPVWYRVPRVASATLVHTCSSWHLHFLNTCITSSKTISPNLSASSTLICQSVKWHLCRTTLSTNRGHHCMHDTFRSMFMWQLHFCPLTQ